MGRRGMMVTFDWQSIYEISTCHSYMLRTYTNTTHTIPYDDTFHRTSYNPLASYGILLSLSFTYSIRKIIFIFHTLFTIQFITTHTIIEWNPHFPSIPHFIIIIIIIMSTYSYVTNIHGHHSIKAVATIYYTVYCCLGYCCCWSHHSQCTIHLHLHPAQLQTNRKIIRLLEVEPSFYSIIVCCVFCRVLYRVVVIIVVVVVLSCHVSVCHVINILSNSKSLEDMGEGNGDGDNFI